MNILQQLAQSSAASAQLREQNKSLEQVLDEVVSNQLSLKSSLLENQTFPVIAEFKRSSPSDPAIGLEKNLESVVREYQNMGASGLSVLTEESKFNGGLADLSLSRKQSNLPKRSNERLGSKNERRERRRLRLKRSKRKLRKKRK